MAAPEADLADIVEFVYRVLAIAVLCPVVLAACGGGGLTLSEYATDVDTLIERVDGRLDAHAEEFFSGPPTVEGTRVYLDDRVAGYHEMVDGIDALDPPEEVVDLHRALQEILSRILVAEEERAAVAATVRSVDELDQVWEGPTAQAVRAAEEEAIVLCRATQERFDDTEAGGDEAFGGPWIPAELQEVVRVALGCP